MAKLTSTRRAAQEFFSHRLRPDPHPSPNLLTEKFLSEGHDDGSLARLHDYQKMAEIVRELPTVAERIQFVSPYERDWTTHERKWHRVQHRGLFETRKAWSIPLTPRYFDCLDFYKYITRMEEVANEEAPFNFPVKSFEKRLVESLLSSMDGKLELTTKSTDEFLRRLLDDAFCSLAHTNDLLDLRISHAPRCESFWICAGFEHLYRKFDMMSSKPADYVFENIRRQKRLIGDHRQRLGEFAFTMRDELVAQVRQRTPIKSRPNLRLLKFPYKWTRTQAQELSMTTMRERNEKWKKLLEEEDENSEDLKDKLKPEEIEEFMSLFSFEYRRDKLLLNPMTYNLWPDSEPLWQCPGYEPENGQETHPFGRLAIKNVRPLNEQIAYWNPVGLEETNQMIDSSLRSSAIASTFNWLNAQAHCAGYTQYGFVDNGKPSDFDETFCSRLILSDGQKFLFATAELRTIAFNISVKGFNNKRMNGIVFDGPFNLYDQFDSTTATFKHRLIDSKDPTSDETAPLVDGLNPAVMKRLLGTVLSK